MKVDDGTKKEDSKPIENGLTDLPVADEQAAETKGSADKIVLESHFLLTSHSNNF